MPSEPNGPRTLTRRALLAGGALAAAAALSSCSLRSAADLLSSTSHKADDLVRKLNGVPDVTVANADEASALALSRISDRFGESFSRTSTDVYELGKDAPMAKYATWKYYRVELVPDAYPDQLFNAFVRADLDTNELTEDVGCDWSIYLFLDQALQPFREALSEAHNLAGWGAKLDYVRYDTNVWKPDQFEEYMGKGLSGSDDPEVIAYLMLPKGKSPEEWAAIIHATEAPLYALGRHLQVIAMEEGQSQKSMLYLTDVAFEGSDRQGVPTEESALEQIKGELPFVEDDPWDGSSSGGDPGLTEYIPQISWNEGHGPGSW